MAYFVKTRSPNARFPFCAESEDFYCHQQPHFLDSCFLCKKRLKPNHDIFMYRGNTPFCSDDCRQEQIETDAAKERPWKLRTLRKQDTPTKSGSKKAVRAGTVAVA